MKILLLRAVELYRTHFFLIACLTLLIWGPCDFIQSYLEHFVFPEDDFAKSFRLTRFFDNFFGIIATSGILYSLEQSSAGIQPSFRSALGAGFSFWGKMWLARFVLGVGLILGLILLIVPGIILLVRSTLLEAVVIREGITGLEANKRAFALTKGYFWRICGWFLSVALVFFVVCFAVGMMTAIPGLDTWIPDAISSIVIDVMAGYFTVLIWVIYDHLVRQEAELVPPLPATV